MVGWHHGLNGHEFEQTLGDNGQGSLRCCSLWCHKESGKATKQEQQRVLWALGILHTASNG